jgi:hypothetical protein
MGDVTLWYQSIWFKHRACMGSNMSELVKFVVADFVCDEFGEKWRI